MIGGVAPSKYLEKIQKHEQVLLDDTQMNIILESHLISSMMIRSDDFTSFYQDRKISLLNLIEKAMGKSSLHIPVIEEDDDELTENSDTITEEGTGWLW